jgi:hypothetical protein
MNRRVKVLRIKILRMAILFAGIVVAQFILYGPSLVGKKILLPLDTLALPRVYQPAGAQTPHDIIPVDLVEQWEPARQFAISEFHAGRLPMWNPNQFAGSPVVWPKFSPFLLFECLTKSPVILAWAQLLAAIVGGLGIYFFLRRAVRVNFWAATIAAWCYPLTGFFIFWQGFPTEYPVYFLPWLLLAVDKTICRRNSFAPIGLAIVTGLILVSGALDVGGQVLLAGGLYAIWRIGDESGIAFQLKKISRAITMLAAGFLCGFLLAAPYLLPLLEYAHTGARMERRSAGAEERPPQGLMALPAAILPDIYGSTQSSSVRLDGGNQKESSAVDYAGIVATLLIAPLAWCSRRHRSLVIFFILLAMFGLSWCLDIPGIVALLRLPVLNMMSHNRLVLATAFAILVLAAIGLDALRRRKFFQQRLFLPFPILLAAISTWAFYRAAFLPEPVATKLSMPNAPEIQNSFFTFYLASGILCAMAFVAWLLIFLRPQFQRRMILPLGILMVVDLLWFAHGRATQCDPALYYPLVPALEAVAKSKPARVIGYNCLPAALAQTAGLRDIRGYDAIDPARLMDVMRLAENPGYESSSYALTQWFSPKSKNLPPDGIQLSPVLDMLNVRYVIFRGTPPENFHPQFQSDDYWVAINHAALPRAFVPQRVEVVSNAEERLQKISSPKFNPRDVAFVETPVNLPDNCNGRVEIANEISTRISISAQMQTPGLVVLADLWDKGWSAYLNGQRAPILRVNHAIRGVVVPAGDSNLEFRYEPASFRLGLQWAAVAAFALAIWTGIILRPRFWPSRVPQSSPSSTPPEN